MKKLLVLSLLVSVFIVAGCTIKTTTTTSTWTVIEPDTWTTTSTINQPSWDFVCEDLYKEIDNDIINANYCKVDADCSILILGAQYVDFGCYHFINKEVDKNQFYKKMDVYNKKCSQSIDRCSPSPKATCVSNTCAYVEK